VSPELVQYNPLLSSCLLPAAFLQDRRDAYPNRNNVSRDNDATDARQNVGEEPAELVKIIEAGAERRVYFSITLCLYFVQRANTRTLSIISICMQDACIGCTRVEANER